MRSYWIGVDSSPTGDIRKGRFGRDTQNEGHVTREAEIGVVQECQGLLSTAGSERDSRKDSPLEPCEGAWLCQNLNFGLLASRAVRE